MCGITGILALNQKPLDGKELVNQMMSRLVHRGPDESGTFENRRGTVCLGHQRLKIIDLETGRQPIANEDGSVVVVFNGEIYGFQLLRDELKSRGHKFITSSDTEVIVHLYEEEDVDALHRLHGMFAFALWDERRQRLFLARDRMGKKPLYYSVTSRSFYFASELHALLAVPSLSRDINHEALDTYLTFGYIPAPNTILDSISKLEAGHYLTVENGTTSKTSYWNLNSADTEFNEKGTDLEDAKAELLTRIRTATAQRMISDVPLGCFLSGGVDSSTILSFMAEISSEPVKTFSIGFSEDSFSELKYARTVAERFGTDHHEHFLQPDAVSILDKLVLHLGEPFADSSALATWYLSELTRKSVTVALTGDGGDELFGGYNWYMTSRLLEQASWIPSWLTRLGSGLSTIKRPRVLRRAGNAASLLSLSPALRHAVLRQIAPQRVRQALYAKTFKQRIDKAALNWLGEQYNQLPFNDSLSRMMATDLKTYMAEDMLVKVDRASMAHSLECRSPLLDTTLAEWALKLPSTMKVTLRGSKLLLKEAVQDRFPPGFLGRPKQGFSLPLESWFRGNLADTVNERVLDGPLRKLTLVDRDGLQNIVSEHLNGTYDHQAMIWALLVLSTWIEQVRPNLG